MAIGENKPQVVSRVAGEVENISREAFREALALKVTEGDTIEEHLTRMSVVFASRMKGIVFHIYDNIDDYAEAPEPDIFGN